MKRNLTATGKTVFVAAISASLAAAPVTSPVAMAALDTPMVWDSKGDTSGGTESGTPGNNNNNNNAGNNNETEDLGPDGSVSGRDNNETEDLGPNVTGGNGGSSNPGGSSGGSGSGNSNGGSTSTKDTKTDTTSYYTSTGSSSSSSSNSSDSTTTTTTTTTTKKSENWTRLGGADRYETMSQIVSKGWSKSDWAVLAVGVSFPDALTASALAGVRDCPVLLTDGSTLSPQAKAQIERLGVKEIYVVGGEGAVSAAVANQVAQLGVKVNRVAGSDRVSTSVQAFREVRAAGSVSDVVIVATGDNFADALSIGSWSYMSKSPIVLARNGSLNDEAIAAIRGDAQVKRIVIVGGTAAVSESVKDQLDNAYEFERLAGNNRYETSSEIANWALNHSLKTANALVATGANFPDALAGAALGGRLGSVMLLEDGSGSAARWLSGKGVTSTTGFVLGGAAAVSDSAMAALK